MRDKDLRKEARKLGLRGYSSLNKAQLVEYLSNEILLAEDSENFGSTKENRGLVSPSEEADRLPKSSPTSVVNPTVNQILGGDCLKILPQFSDGVFDCCIADPPFNMSKKKGLGWAFSSHITMQAQWDMFTRDDYFQFTFDWIQEVKRVVKTNGNLFIFGSFHSIFTIGFILQNVLNLRIITQIVWYKPNAQPNITCRMFTESTEFIIWAVNNDKQKAKNWTFNYQAMKAMNNNKQMRNMWEIPLTKKSERRYGNHPSQKPEAIIERLILAGTNEGDIILDPFSGTGTTGVIAEKHKRSWVMIEKEGSYNLIAQRRIEDLWTTVQ